MILSMRSVVRGFGHPHDEWNGDGAASSHGSFTYLGPIDARLADNSSVVTHVYEGVILWNNLGRSIPVLAMGDFPLIGTALLKGSHLSIDFCDAGIVTVD